LLRLAPGFLGAFLILYELGLLVGLKLGDQITIIVTWGLLLGLFFLVIRYELWCLYEGRRFWPRWVKRRLTARLQEKLNKDFQKSRELRRRIDELSSQADLSSDKIAELDQVRSEYDELWFRIRQYPEDRKQTWKVTNTLQVGMRKATAPTRFGNIIDEFETYPLVRYGIDPIFFWYRLRLLIPKDAYETVDTAAAVVDCLVSMSVLFVAFAPVSLAIGVTSSVALSVVVALASLLMSYVAYLVSLSRLRSYGEHFKAMFEMYRGDLLRQAKELIQAAKDPQEFEFWQDMVRYLWYRIALSDHDILADFPAS
jgi:hypothetical protein